MLEVREREVCTSKACLYCHSDNNKSTDAGHSNPFDTQTPIFPPPPEDLLLLYTCLTTPCKCASINGCTSASPLVKTIADPTPRGRRDIKWWGGSGRNIRGKKAGMYSDFHGRRAFWQRGGPPQTSSFFSSSSLCIKTDSLSPFLSQCSSAQLRTFTLPCFRYRFQNCPIYMAMVLPTPPSLQAVGVPALALASL